MSRQQGLLPASYVVFFFQLYLLMDCCVSAVNSGHGRAVDPHREPIKVAASFWLLNFTALIETGKYYYEATVTDEGLCRVGWATQAGTLELGKTGVVFLLFLLSLFHDRQGQFWIWLWWNRQEIYLQSI